MSWTRRILVIAAVIAALVAGAAVIAATTGRSFLLSQSEYGAGKAKYLACHYFMYDQYILKGEPGAPESCPFFFNANAKYPKTLPTTPQ
jgi:hypothetical protein